MWCAARARGKAVKNRRYRCIYGFVFVFKLMNYWLTGWWIDWVWAVCGRAASRKLSSDRHKNNMPNAMRMKMAPPAIIQTALRLLKSHFMCDGSDGSIKMVVSTFIGGTLPPLS